MSDCMGCGGNVNAEGGGYCEQIERLTARVTELLTSYERVALELSACEDKRGEALRERDEARAERDRYRDVLLSKHGGEPVALIAELDEARSDLRASGQVIEDLRGEVARLQQALHDHACDADCPVQTLLATQKALVEALARIVKNAQARTILTDSAVLKGVTSIALAALAAAEGRGT